jgi:hypothetical protein
MELATEPSDVVLPAVAVEPPDAAEAVLTPKPVDTVEQVSPVAVGHSPEIETIAPEQDEPILPEGPVQLPDKGSPKYAFDYRGRLWVEKKRKGFFRQLRRPQIPPEEPPDKAER